MGSEPTLASKSQDSARGLGIQDCMVEKLGSEAMPASKSQDSSYMPPRMTFRSHVEKTGAALSFKAAWFLEVIFTGIYGQASGVPGPPPPPPQWYGLVGVGGGAGAGVCGEWSGRLGGVLLWAAMGHREGRDLTQTLRL